MKTVIAVLRKDGGNAIPHLLKALEISYSKKGTCFGLATPSKFFTTTNFETLQKQEIRSSNAIGYSRTESASQIELPIIVKEKDATISFDGNIYSTKSVNLGTDSFGEKRLYPHSIEAIRTFLNNAEGDFSLLVVRPSDILATRDSVGVAPLYYGESKELMALGSNRKVLWSIGVQDVKSFPPGHIGIVSRDSFNFEPVKVFTFSDPKPILMNDAARKLQKLLERSVEIRVRGQDKVAVAFSGGLDSSVVAKLAKNCGSNVQLFHVSLKGQHETEEAIRAAKLLDLPLQVFLYTEADLQHVISKVVNLIEESDPTKAGVGVPFYWNAQVASAAGFRVLLAGQGADELFGGYLRYVNEYLRDGDEKVRRTIFNDVAEIYGSNLERDEKICVFHDVELRLPFASYPVVEFALSLPTELKFENSKDSLRKLVLRKMAENLGLPQEIVKKPKKAVQYSTGINTALKKLAKRQGCTLQEYINKIFDRNI